MKNHWFPLWNWTQNAWKNYIKSWKTLHFGAGWAPLSLCSLIWKMKEATHTVRFEPGYGGGPSAGFFEHVLQAFNSSEMIENSFCGRRRQTSNKRKPNEKTTTYWAEIENSWTEIENSWMRLKILEMIHFLHLYKWCVDWDKNSNKRKEHSQTLVFSWNHKKFGIKSPP